MNNLYYYSKEDLNYSHPGDRGVDLKATSIEIKWVNKEPILMYGTEVYVYSEKGDDIQLRARSSISTKVNLLLANGIGTIDSGYTGELKFAFCLRGFRMPTLEESLIVEYGTGNELILNYHKKQEPVGKLMIVGDLLSSASFTIYEVGDKIGQLVVGKKGQAELVKLSEIEFNLLTEGTSRGEGGFGSTGKR